MTTYCGLQLTNHDGETFTILSFPAVVGKLRGCDLRISGNPTVSRKHARLLHADNSFAVEDLGSTNKTFVQGYEAKPGIPMVLSEGDVVCFSDAAFKVHLIAYDSYTLNLMRDSKTSWTMSRR